MAVLFSVVVSGVTQIFYTLYQANKYLPLKIDIDRKFTINHLKSNRNYGVAYFLSSFHTLIVGLLLSIFYPTTL
jgi:hypothetical protein